MASSWSKGFGGSGGQLGSFGMQNFQRGMGRGGRPRSVNMQTQAAAQNHADGGGLTSYINQHAGALVMGGVGTFVVKEGYGIAKSKVEEIFGSKSEALNTKVEELDKRSAKFDRLVNSVDKVEQRVGNLETQQTHLSEKLDAIKEFLIEDRKNLKDLRNETRQDLKDITKESQLQMKEITKETNAEMKEITRLLTSIQIAVEVLKVEKASKASSS